MIWPFSRNKKGLHYTSDRVMSLIDALTLKDVDDFAKQTYKNFSLLSNGGLEYRKDGPSDKQSFETQLFETADNIMTRSSSWLGTNENIRQDIIEGFKKFVHQNTEPSFSNKEEATWWFQFKDCVSSGVMARGGVDWGNLKKLSPKNRDLFPEYTNSI
jgi:hypothetical protein